MFREITAVCRVSQMKHINTNNALNGKLQNVRVGHTKQLTVCNKKCVL